MPKTSRLSTDPTREAGSPSQRPTPILPPKTNPFEATVNHICALLDDPETPSILLDHLVELVSQMGDMTGIRCAPVTPAIVRRQLPLILAKAKRIRLSVAGIEWELQATRGGLR